MDKRTVVLTRFALAHRGQLPDLGWMHERLRLLRVPQRSLSLAAVPDLLWVLLVDPSTPDEVRRELSSFEIPHGRVLVMDIWRVPQPGLARLAPAAFTLPEHAAIACDKQALVFRLDSDDALLPHVIPRVQRIAENAPGGAIFDMWAGYRYDTVSRRLSQAGASSRWQGPFLARLSHGLEDALDLSAEHPVARRSASRVYTVPGRSFLQVVHGGNVVNADPGWPSLRRSAARAVRGTSGSLRRRAWHAMDGWAAFGRRDVRDLVEVAQNASGVNSPCQLMD